MERGRSVLLEDLKLGPKTNRPRKKKAASSTARIAAHRCRCSCPPPKPDLLATASLTWTQRGRRAAPPCKTSPCSPHPLGSKGQLQGVHWQVVGFQHHAWAWSRRRRALGWSEYLLYNQSAALLSWSIPKGLEHGAPHHRRAPALVQRPHRHVHGHQVRAQIQLRGRNHLRAGRVLLAGEPGQKTSNRDFASSKALLSLEQSPTKSPGPRATRSQRHGGQGLQAR